MVPQPPPVGLGNVDARPGPVTSCGLDRVRSLAYDVPAQLGHCPTLGPGRQDPPDRSQTAHPRSLPGCPSRQRRAPSSMSPWCSPCTTSGATCGKRSTASGQRSTHRTTATKSSRWTTARTTVPARSWNAYRHPGDPFLDNRGSGTARRVGTGAARGRVVVWTDADMTYPNDRIPELVDELDGYDQVVGARTSEQGTLKMFRVPAKWLIRSSPPTSQSAHPRPELRPAGVPARCRHAVPAPAPQGFSCVTTMTMSFLANGYSVKHLPIDYAPRAGRSKFHWWADTRRTSPRSSGWCSPTTPCGSSFRSRCSWR